MSSIKSKQTFNKNKLLKTIKNYIDISCPIFYVSGYETFDEYMKSSFENSKKLTEFTIKNRNNNIIIFHSPKKHSYFIEYKKNDRDEFIIINNQIQDLKILRRFLQNGLSMNEECGICYETVPHDVSPNLFNALYKSCDQCFTLMCVQCISKMCKDGKLECPFCKYEQKCDLQKTQNKNNLRKNTS